MKNPLKGIFSIHGRKSGPSDRKAEDLGLTDLGPRGEKLLTPSSQHSSSAVQPSDEPHWVLHTSGGRMPEIKESNYTYSPGDDESSDELSDEDITGQVGSVNEPAVPLRQPRSQSMDEDANKRDETEQKKVA